MAERSRQRKTSATTRRKRAAPVARRLGRPPATNSAETRHRVVQVARRHFGDLGYDATTNKGVAQDADITTGAIYHYFDSKEELYRAVAEEAGDTIIDRFKDAVDGVDGCVAKLRAALDCALALEEEDPSLAAFVVSVPVEARRHPELADIARAQNDRNLDFFRGIIEEGLATGEIARDSDVNTILEVTSAMMGGLARHATIVQDYDRHAVAIGGFQRMLDGTLFTGKKPRAAKR